MAIECDIVTLVFTHILSFFYGALIGVVAGVFVCKIFSREG